MKALQVLAFVLLLAALSAFTPAYALDANSCIKAGAAMKIAMEDRAKGRPEYWATAMVGYVLGRDNAPGYLTQLTVGAVHLAYTKYKDMPATPDESAGNVYQSCLADWRETQ